jgi:hypothetical protein
MALLSVASTGTAEAGRSIGDRWQEQTRSRSYEYEHPDL